MCDRRIVSVLMFVTLFVPVLLFENCDLILTCVIETSASKDSNREELENWTLFASKF